MPPKKKATKQAAEEEPAEAPTKKQHKTEAPAATPANTATKPSTPAESSGSRPVDREVPGRGGYSVFKDYSITLNQTNIGGNNNKYYIIQLLEGGGKFHTWNRWGRVGEPGQNKFQTFGTFEAAKQDFEKKFKDKSGNNWSQRDSFSPKDGKYTIVEMDDKEGGEGSGDASAPMGKLSKGQIEKGQGVLAELRQVIETNGSHSKLTDLSSKFFTLIPTNFGRTRPQPITSLDKLCEKEELLKFYLRMGFEEVDDTTKHATPISGVMELPVPKTLAEAIFGACGDDSAIKKSVSQGDTLAKKQSGNPIRPLNKEQYGSIMLYTSNAIYRDLNKVLRDEKRTAVQKYFRYLRLLFDATEALPKKNVTLWRGISVDLSGQYKVGETITWWGVSSCTSDQQVARNFMNGCGGDCSFLTIETKTAVDISAITFYSNEKESLLLPGTQLLIKKVEKKGKVAEIHMEEVGRLVS